MNKTNYPPAIKVKSCGIADAYYKLIQETLRKGTSKTIYNGTSINPISTLNIISFTEINNPLSIPSLHPDFSINKFHKKQKQNSNCATHILTDNLPGSFINFTDRFINYPSCSGLNPILQDYYHKFKDLQFIDQLQIVNDRIREEIKNPTAKHPTFPNQIITWIPDRDLNITTGQPCLQRLQFIIHKYPHDEFLGYDVDGEIWNHLKGSIELHLTWSSKDLYETWNIALSSLINTLNQKVFLPNNLKLVRIIDFCDSLYIKESDKEHAAKVKPFYQHNMLSKIWRNQNGL